MRFASLYLKNYIGIYNGMGLKEIFINFDSGGHRIVVIRGDNGSGKSTIMKSLSVFPDGNEQFIPGLEATKEINLFDNGIIYTITFVHSVKSNGTRDVTKAYISKTYPNGETVKLNENGNVSSYKSIIYDELGIDSNFESLSKLSTDDRGIADKKPAERKKFVNSILNNLDFYNDIFKSLSKKSSSIKGLINSIGTKLSMIGDPANLATSISGIDNRINTVQDSKDKEIERLAKAKASMELIDPDGSIKSLIEQIKSENDRYKEEIDRVSSLVTSLRMKANISLVEDVDSLLSSLTSKINSLNIENQLHRGEIERYLSEREAEASELSSKLQRLQSFEQDWTYETICDDLAKKQAELLEIERAITQSGISVSDIGSFTRDSYIIALESVKKIIEEVNNMIDGSDAYLLDSVVSSYIRNGTIPRICDTKAISDDIDRINREIKDTERIIEKRLSEQSIMESLSHRPKGCKIDDCEFIRDAISIVKESPKPTLQEATDTLESLKMDLSAQSNALDNTLEWNACVTKLSNLLRDIDSYRPIVSKLACGSIFARKAALVEAIFKNSYVEVLDTIYGYISVANLFDEYKALSDSIRTLESEKAIYESRQDIVDEIQTSIDRINLNLQGLDEKIKSVQARLASNDKTLVVYQTTLGVLQSISDNESILRDLKESLKQNQDRFNANIDKISKYDRANKTAKICASMIDAYNRELDPLFAERDKMNHQIRLVDDYNKELAELTANYDMIEKIRYYSSPTTGIQLVFMEMYIGKIIDMANELLSMFFGGKFRIMPFIINESEFRIPCAGEGILNDDISSMSSAQIAMISMILSFSFLFNTTTRYNILKLDEIDGPLDTSNRTMFVDVLNRVMDSMGVEQCIIISHNSELQSYDSDTILLRSSEEADYGNCNIIWKY